MSTTTTPNMGLTLPGVLSEPGPAYAIEINSDLSVLDAHDHTGGKGALVPVAGLSIAADFPLNGNNVNNARSYRMQNNGSVLSGPSDINSLYDFSGDLYFNNASNVPIRITNNGAINNPSVNLFNPTTISSNATISNTDTFNFIKVITAASAVQLTLPAASSVSAGRFFYIKDVSNNAVANNITLVKNGFDTFDSVASNLILNTNLGACIIVSDHVSNWNVFYFTTKIMLDGRYGTDTQNVLVQGDTVAIKTAGSNTITIGATSNSIAINGAAFNVSSGTDTHINSTNIILGTSSSTITNKGNTALGSSDGPTTTTIGVDGSDSLDVESPTTFKRSVTFNSASQIVSHYSGVNSFEGSINTLSVATTAGLTVGTTIGVTGALAVGGASTLVGNVGITGNTTLTGTLTANGQSTFNNTIFIGTGNIQSTVTGNQITLTDPIKLASFGRISKRVVIGGGSGTGYSPAQIDYVLTPTSGGGGGFNYGITSANCFAGDVITFINRSNTGQITIFDDSGGNGVVLAATGGLPPRWVTWYHSGSGSAPFFQVLYRSPI